MRPGAGDAELPWHSGRFGHPFAAYLQHVCHAFLGHGQLMRRRPVGRQRQLQTAGAARSAEMRILRRANSWEPREIVPSGLAPTSRSGNRSTHSARSRETPVVLAAAIASLGSQSPVAVPRERR